MRRVLVASLLISVLALGVLVALSWPERNLPPVATPLFIFVLFASLLLMAVRGEEGMGLYAAILLVSSLLVNYSVFY